MTIRSVYGLSSSSDEYSSWEHMHSRCRNPKHTSYHRYGGRGITVCQRWNSSANFLSDMGPKPTKAHTLERIDNNGNYEPSNCRWATRKEQALNSELTEAKLAARLTSESVRRISPRKLTESQVQEIRRARGVPKKQLAKAFGVSRPTISAILSRKLWAWVPEKP